VPVSLFSTTATGSGSVGTSAWIDLGTIPTGHKIWLGSSSYTVIDKATSFSIRTNTTGKSSSTLADTTSLDLVSAKTGVTVTRDFYRKGRLHIVSTLGTGVEKLWLYITSKSGTTGSYLYSIYYTTE
jgi:hypothetical protein